MRAAIRGHQRSSRGNHGSSVYLMEPLAVTNTPAALHELWRRRRVAHAEPPLRLAKLVLLAEVPVARSVPEHAVVVAHLRRGREGEGG